MLSFQDLKAKVEAVTGMGRPNVVIPRKRKAYAAFFLDDGDTPNNPRFPFIHYRTPIRIVPGYDPAALFEVLFAANGWKPAWRDSIYPYNHFHTQTHEVLGIARGHARLRVGGAKGHLIKVVAGDVFVHPAGVGHRRLSASKDLLVVGGYPRKGGKYDEPQPHEVNHAQAVANIAKVGLPPGDPVYGADGPLMRIWRRRKAT